MSAAFDIVRERLLRNPSLINSRAAAVRLLSAKEKCSASEAQDLLGKLKLANGFQALFKSVMPDEFARDQGSRAGIAARFARALGFPIDIWNIENLLRRQADPLLEGIPIDSMSGHVCDGCCEFHYLPPLVQLTILVFGNELEIDHDLLDAEAAGMYAEEKESRWELFAKEHDVPDRLRPTEEVKELWKVYERQRTPLRFLPLLSRMLDYSTGCVFFDFNPDDVPPEIAWTNKNIVWLRSEFELAQRIDSNLESLSAWFYEDPKARIVKALRLYKTAAKPLNGKTRKPRVANAARGTLVRIL